MTHIALIKKDGFLYILTNSSDPKYEWIWWHDQQHTARQVDDIKHNHRDQSMGNLTRWVALGSFILAEGRWEIRAKVQPSSGNRLGNTGTGFGGVYRCRQPYCPQQQSSEDEQIIVTIIQAKWLYLFINCLVGLIYCKSTGNSGPPTSKFFPLKRGRKFKKDSSRLQETTGDKKQIKEWDQGPKSD